MVHHSRTGIRSDIPLLSMLQQHKTQLRNEKNYISGELIASHLTYHSLIDLLPNTNSIAIQEPGNQRSPLTHHELKTFITSQFNLEKYGLPPNSRIGILVPNGPELAVCLVSVLSNWCAIPISTQSTEIEMEHELKGTQAQAIIVLAEEGSEFENASLSVAERLDIGVFMLNPSPVTCGLFTLSLLRPVHYRPVNLKPLTKLRQQLMDMTSYGHPQISLVLHTSGTSGNKKRVPYTLDSLIIGVACIITAWDLTPSDVNLNMMPLFHIGGIIRNVLSPILSGGSVITCPGFDPVLFWDILYDSTMHATWYYAAPTMHHAILQQADRIASLHKIPRNQLHGTDKIRFIANAAGALLPALASELQHTFEATILTGYGMTECMPISSPPLWYKLDPPGTSGIPCGPEVLIVDPSHTEVLPPGVSGHIMVRGTPCFSGYEAEDDATNEESFYTIQNTFGYFDAGDIGYLDENGFLFITGRSKEVINRGGETISPFEIEEALIQHPAILEACAFRKHARYQETIGTVLVMKPGFPRIDIPSLHKYLEAHLQRSKWPQIIVYMNSLPKNNTNKILRIKLAERMNLPEIDDDIPPLERLYEGQCPQIGTALTVPIPINKILISPHEIESFILDNFPELSGKCKVLSLNISGHSSNLVAFISSENQELEKLILLLCANKLDGYKCPTLIISLSESLYVAEQNNPIILTEIALQRYHMNNLILPRNPLESQLEIIWRTLLQSSSTLSVTSSFFDLGGDSLQAGQVINAIRKQLQIQLSVSDLFLSPTIEKLAHKITTLQTSRTFHPTNIHEEMKSSEFHTSSEQNYEKFQSWEFSSQHYSSTSLTVLLIQALPLLIIYPFRRIIIWFSIAAPWVYLMKLGYSRFGSLIASILLAHTFAGIIYPFIGIAFKWLIIGKYKSGRYPMWGTMYLKWWLVDQVLMIFGKGFFRGDVPLFGSELIKFYYLLLGAKIGKNVVIHDHAKLGEFDLLNIGDDVTIDASIIRPGALEECHMILLPITIHNNCSIGVKSTVAPGTYMMAGTSIGPLSSSHEILPTSYEDRKYCRSSFLSPPIWMVMLIGFPIFVFLLGVSYSPWYFGLKVMVLQARQDGWYEDIQSIHQAILWWITPQRLKYYFLICIIKRCVIPFVRLFFIIIIKWVVIGKFTPLSGAEKATDWNTFRYWLMANLLPGGKFGGVSKLVGTHYEVVSHIFRALGAKVGKRVYWPGSGLSIVEYDLLEVGNDVVFGSRSIALTSSVERSAPIIIEDGCMVADRCVLLPGLHMKRGSVLGSGSLSPEDFECPMGSVWVGSHQGSCINVAPEDLTYEVKDTTTPFGRAFYEKKAPYTVIPLWGIIVINISWNAFCTCYQHTAAVLALSIVNYLRIYHPNNIFLPMHLFQLFFMIYVPIFVASLSLALLFEILMKWILMGRRKQGIYSWDQSNYCQNWQLYLSLAEIRRGENGRVGILDVIRGSQYLVWYFRMLGANIGKNVCLYPNGGDPMMTEPDLVTIDDGAAIDDASLVAHINTRGVFRLNPLHVGKNCVLKSNTRLLSGAQMSDSSILQEHTLVLAGDIVDGGTVWQGWPSNHIIPLPIYRQQLLSILNDSIFHYGTSKILTSPSPMERASYSSTSPDECHVEMEEFHSPV